VAARTFLVTGGAGFIGSNVAEALVRRGDRVRVLDNFCTGKQQNLKAAGDVELIEGDLRDPDTVARAVRGVEGVFHQAALRSVPRSVDDPTSTNDVNVGGTLTLLVACREDGVRRVVYASSSSAYGDDPTLPKVETLPSNPISPYAVAKLAAEHYCRTFARLYGLETVSLRYFNVFGPRQDPKGAYAAVIPAWIASLLEGQPVFINGDGETSRDFCHVLNVVQANVLAACRPMPESTHRVYNVAVGERTTLNQLYELIQGSLAALDVPGHVKSARPTYRDFRAGDVRHSLADTAAARQDLGYAPTHDVQRGMRETIAWYLQDYRKRQAKAG